MSEFSHTPGVSYEPLRRILSNERIKNIQERIKVRHNEEPISWDTVAIGSSDLDDSNWVPSLLIAIDGDYSVSKIETGFPGSEIGYVTVSSVIILIDKIRQLEKQEFIDPREFRKTESASSLDSVFVGCNAVLDGEVSAESSLRRTLYEEFSSQRISDGGETLLATYEEMLRIRIASSEKTRLPKCPHDTCDADLKLDFGEYQCDHCNGKLYSTDALRLHELMNPSGTSGEMFGQIKEALKKLRLIHILRTLEQREDGYRLFRELAFFIEGSLTVFSAPSWLAKSFRVELARINAEAKKQASCQLLILGIERSGNFVNHFAELDTKKDGASGNFPSHSVFLPTNKYICKNIVLNDDPQFIYLKDTAFGRKFLYKTKHGLRVVASVASFNEYQSNVETAFPEQFPRLKDCLNLLDELVSTRYGNSAMPLASAHSEAAIPLNLGKPIFDNISKEIRERS
ncbi:MAG: DNA double-strand break repair nuclease NurA [Alphaproteobacteria bacterium]|nr:DNA double-strand break repair nuclease NurA [Alphaproteobacteria bacterium]